MVGGLSGGKGAAWSDSHWSWSLEVTPATVSHGRLPRVTHSPAPREPGGLARPSLGMTPPPLPCTCPPRVHPGLWLVPAGDLEAAHPCPSTGQLGSHLGRRWAWGCDWLLWRAPGKGRQWAQETQVGSAPAVKRRDSGGPPAPRVREGRLVGLQGPGGQEECPLSWLSGRGKGV